MFNNPRPEDQNVHPLQQHPALPPAPAQPVEDVNIFRPKINFKESQVRFTYILIAINVIVFILDYLSGSTLTLLGMKDNGAILAGQYWRLITPVFLHGGILHLAFNNYFLYVMGPRVEKAFGFWRFVAIYFLSSVVGVIASFLLSPRPSIGASGALFGLMGALIPYLLKNKKVLRNSSQILKAVLQTVGINLLIGLSPGIDNWAHLGGLLSGAALAALIAPVYQLRGETDGSITIHDTMDKKLIVGFILAFALAVLAFFFLALTLKG